jgi:hypothetical protein
MDHRSLDTTRGYYTNPRELHQPGEEAAGQLVSTSAE